MELITATFWLFTLGLHTAYESEFMELITATGHGLLVLGSLNGMRASLWN